MKFGNKYFNTNDGSLQHTVMEMKLSKDPVSDQDIMSDILSSCKSPLVSVMFVEEAVRGRLKKTQSWKYSKTKLVTTGMLGRCRPQKTRGTMATEQASHGEKYKIEKHGVKYYTRVKLWDGNRKMTDKECVKSIMDSECSDIVKAELAEEYLVRLLKKAESF